MALAGALGGACAANDRAPTSVFLEIFDATPVTSATDVDLEVYAGAGAEAGAGANQLASLHRTAAAQISGGAPLGSVVILAGADGGVAALRIQGRRSSAGVVLSQGTVDVTLVVDRQVSARLDLTRAGQGDGGSVDGAGGSDVAAPRDTGGRGDTGTPSDAVAPADATAPADAATDRAGLLRNGDSCTAAGVCGSGFCVDGVCCNNDCSALCHACNLTGARGTCTQFTAGSQCVSAACDTSDRLVPARLCDSNGNCLAATPVSCGNYRCQNADCPRSCSNDSVCISTSSCTFNRCQ